MSWFTTDAQYGTAICHRCKSPDFVRLVKNVGQFNIYDCKRCEVPTTTVKKNDAA